MKAFDWLIRAAQLGHAVGQAEVGFMYLKGMAVTMDYEKAFEWFGKSAAQKCRDGAFYMGLMLGEGKGVEKNDTKAFGWYMLSAQLGHVRGQAACGYMYMSGIGVTQDDAQGYAWYSKAAAHGAFAALFSLGHMHYRGRHVEKNLAQAANLLCQAGQRGATLVYPKDSYCNELLPYILQELDRRGPITKLVLANGEIDDQGAKAIAAMLKNNSTLNELDISSNQIGPSGALAILQALHSNTTLRACIVEKNPAFPTEMEVGIARAIGQNLQIAVLLMLFLERPRNLTPSAGILPEVGQLIIQALILIHQKRCDPQTNKPLNPTWQETERLLLELACVISHG